ncbi:hypothetical protein ACFL47_04880 [Candidatus Latescibacterota bacterium]
MNCHEFEDNMAPYLDGFLDGDLKRTMDEHRACCEACTRLAEAHSLVVKSLDMAEPVKAPAGLADSILARIEAESATEKAPEPVIDCAAFEDHIAAFVDGILDGQLTAAMSEHRATCNACDRKARMHELIVTSLNTTEQIKAPAGLAARIMTAIEAYNAETALAARRAPRLGIAAAAFAAAASLVAAVFPLWNIMSKRFPAMLAAINGFGEAINPSTAVTTISSTASSQSTRGLLFIQNWMSTHQVSEEWTSVLNMAFQPVEVPYMAFSMPPYMLAVMIALTGIMWKYMNDTGYSTARQSSYT